jgi:carboxylesterase type B
MKIGRIFCLFLACSAHALFVSSGRKIIARTNQNIVYGVQVHENVKAFLGIPFAQPPIGSLCFRPPQPLQFLAQNKRTALNATSFGPVCYQSHYKTVLGDSLLPTTVESEDCLTLNIFVPRDVYHNRTKLPVFVWSYGGAFGEGGGSVLLSNPTQLVAENKDIIVVIWK